MGIFDDLQKQVTGGGALGAHVVHVDPQHSLELPLAGLLRRLGGLRGVARRLRASGYGAELDSWLSSRSPAARAAFTRADALAAFGRPTLAALSRETGQSLGEVTSILAQALPVVIDHLSPDGRLPDHEPEADSIVRLAITLVPDACPSSPKWNP